MLRALALRLGGREEFAEGELDAAYREEVKRWLQDGNGRAWHYDLYLAAGEDAELRDP